MTGPSFTGRDMAASAAHLAAAKRFVQAQQLDRALEEAKRAATIDPANTEAYAYWGVSAAELGRFVDALQPLQVAADRSPPGTVGWANLVSQRVRALSNVGFWSEAVRLAQAVEAYTPPDPPVRQRIGAAYARVGLIERGLPHLQWAVQARPDLLEAQVELGVAYLSLGRLDEAEQALENAIALSPLWPQPHMALAAMRRWTDETAHIARLRAVMADPAVNAFDRASLGFSLFKELNDLGRRDEAWPVLVESNDAIGRQRSSWSAAEDRELVQALIDTFPADAFDRARTPGRPAGPTPIFVLGLPRSGTTLVERILASHSQVVAMGELPTFPLLFRAASNAADRRILNEATIRGVAGWDWSVTAEDYLAQTAFLAGDARFVTDKLPANSLTIGAVRMAFPDAPIVLLSRDPMDTLYSAYRVQFSGLYGWSYRQEDLADHYANHQRLMAHWRACLGDGLVDVRYEDLVADPEPQIRRLLEACGLPFEEACVRPHETAGAVRTASIVQVRRPISASSIGGWRRYERELEPLRARLEALGFPAQ